MQMHSYTAILYCSLLLHAQALWFNSGNHQKYSSHHAKTISVWTA